MANSSFSISGIPTAAKWDEKLVFAALISQPRRKLLFALATGGPQTAANLAHVGRGSGPCRGKNTYLDSTLKNLKVLTNAGPVVQLENPQDRRRSLYALAPELKVTVGVDETVIDFDFCVVRLSADGN